MRAVFALLSMVALYVASSVTFAAGPPPSSTQAQSSKDLVRRTFHALESGDLKTLNDVCDPQGPIHPPQGKTVLQGGPFTDLKGSCPMCAALNPRKITLDLMVAEEDLVTVRSTWSGKYSGTYRGMPVSDKDVLISYTNVYRIAGGKIIENWVGVDRLSLAEQLGMKLVPASTPAAN